MSRNRGWSLTDAARDAEIDLHPGGDREGAMGRQFQATIPGQRGHEPVLAHEETQVPFAEGDDATETEVLQL